MGMHGAARSRLQPWLLALTSHTQALHPLLAAASPLCVHDTCLAATGVCAAAGLGLCATGRQHAAEAAPGDLRRVQQPPLYLPAAHEHSCWGAGSEPHGSQQSGEGGGVAGCGWSPQEGQTGRVCCGSEPCCLLPCVLHSTRRDTVQLGCPGRLPSSQPAHALWCLPASCVRLCLTHPGTLHTTCKPRTGHTAWVRHVTWPYTAWWAQVITFRAHGGHAQ